MLHKFESRVLRLTKAFARGACQAVPHHFPWDALYYPRFEFLGAPLDFDAPSFLDPFLDLRVKAID